MLATLTLPPRASTLRLVESAHDVFLFRALITAVLAAVTIVSLPACSGSLSTLTAPTEPGCQTGNTATVYFESRSVSNRTYDILLDGSQVAAVGPAQNSNLFVVAAGVQHTVLFRLSNTGIAACAELTPVFAQCANQIVGCAF